MSDCLKHLSRINKLPEDVYSKEDKRNLESAISEIAKNNDFVKASELADEYFNKLKDKNAKNYRARLLSKKMFDAITPEIDRYKSKNRFMVDFMDNARLKIDTTKNVIISKFLDAVNELGKDGASFIVKPENSGTVIDALEKLIDNPETVIKSPTIANVFAKQYLDQIKSLYENGKKLGLSSGKLKDHLTIQSHDADKMLAPFPSRFQSLKERTKMFSTRMKPSEISRVLSEKAEKLWIDHITPLLDHERTFGTDITTDEQKEQFLKDAYRNITLGKVDTDNISVGSNGSSRILHFKDKSSWLTYHQTYGVGTMFDSLTRTIETAGKKLGLAEALGPKPRDYYDKVKDYSAKNQTHGKQYAASHFDAKFDPRYESLTSSGYRPEQTLLTRSLNAIQSLQMMDKLGFSGISSTPDTARLLSRSANTGQPYFRRISQIVEGMSPVSATASDRRKLYKSFNFLMKDSAMHFQNEFSPGSSKMWPKMMMKYFNFNLQQPFDRYVRTTSAQLYAGHFYDLLKKKFTDLDPDNKELIGKHGFGEQEFNLFKNNIDKFKVLKRGGYVTPEAIDSISDNDIKDYAGEKLDQNGLDRHRSTLQRNIAQMYYDNASFVQSSPDNFDKAIVGINSIKNANLRAVTNSLMMFKWFGFTSIRKTLSDIYLSKTTDDLIPSIANASMSTHGRMISYVMTSAIQGMAADMAIQMLKTGKIENPTDHPYRFLLYSLSAPLGLLGSIVSSVGGTGEFRPWETFTGPVGGFMKDAVSTLKTMATFDSSGKRLNYHDRVLRSLLNFSDRNVIPHTAWTNQLYYNHVFNPLMNKVDPDYLSKKYEEEQKKNPNPLYQSDNIGVKYL